PAGPLSEKHLFQSNSFLSTPAVKFAAWHGRQRYVGILTGSINCLNSRPADFLVTFAITIHKRLILFGVLMTTGFPRKLFALLHPYRWPLTNARAVRIVDDCLGQMCFIQDPGQGI